MITVEPAVLVSFAVGILMPADGDWCQRYPLFAETVLSDLAFAIGNLDSPQLGGELAAGALGGQLLSC